MLGSRDQFKKKPPKISIIFHISNDQLTFPEPKSKVNSKCKNDFQKLLWTKKFWFVNLRKQTAHITRDKTNLAKLNFQKWNHFFSSECFQNTLLSPYFFKWKREYGRKGKDFLFCQNEIFFVFFMIFCNPFSWNFALLSRFEELFGVLNIFKKICSRGDQK